MAVPARPAWSSLPGWSRQRCRHR